MVLRLLVAGNFLNLSEEKISCAKERLWFKRRTIRQRALFEAKMQRSHSMLVRAGVRQQECTMCAAVGEKRVFFSPSRFQQHQRQHDEGVVFYLCSCGERVANRADLRAEHQMQSMCDRELSRKRRRQRNDGEEDAAEERRCPRCGRVINGSVSHLDVHVETCADAGAVEMQSEGEEIALEHEHVAQVMFDESAPNWLQEREFRVEMQALPSIVQGDAMLLYGLISSGHYDVSNGAFDFLFKLFSTPAFRDALLDGEISRSFSRAQKALTQFQKEEQWKEVHTLKSTFFVRDLRDVVLEFLEDGPLVKSLELTGRGEGISFEGRDSVLWGKHWTAFPVYQTRRQQVKSQFGNECELISFGLWLDAGETDRLGSSSIYMIALAPLNAPLSRARRPDCIFPVAYVYNDEDVLNTLRYLLPQMVSLRQQPREVTWHDGSKRRMCFSIDVLSGDHPAITKALGVVMTASSNFPCKVCMISKRDETEPLNDCARWRAFLGPEHLRTQEKAEHSIELMRAGVLGQPETGVREAFIRETHPIFEYFRLNGPQLDAFVCTVSDTMHDLYLGLYKECFKALANQVLSEDGQQVRAFKGGALKLSESYLFGNDATLFRRGDVRDGSGTDLLHLLQNGSLYAREYQSLAPVLLVLFDSVGSRKIDRAVTYMAGLVSFGALLESREWPLNAGDEWWDSVQGFAISCYEGFQRAMVEWLPHSANLVKVHDVLCHSLRAHRLHGPFLKTQGFEGMFRFFQRFTTNRKDVGKQLFGKMLQYTRASKWLAQEQEGALAVRELIDGAQNEDREAGNCREQLSKRVVELMERLCQKNGWTLEKCPKWIDLLQHEDAGKATRGARKIYAAPQFHGRAKFDLVELGLPGQEHYMMLQGIGTACSADRRRFTIVCGIDLLEVAGGCFHMPLVRCPPLDRAKLKVRLLDPVYCCPVMAIPHLRSLEDPSYREALSRVKDAERVRIVQFSRQEQLYHVNIFATHGEGRYFREWRWYPGVDASVN